MLKPTLIARGAVFMPSASRDGSTLAWSNREDGTRDIYLQRHGQTTRLTSDAEVDTEPALTPDGDVLLWSRRSEGGEWDLYEYSRGEILPFLTDEGPQRKPRFSSDGSTLVFEDRGGVGLMRDGERQHFAKADNNQESRRPRVNADGTRVFWERFNATDRTTTLWMRDQDGVEKALLKPDSKWTSYDINAEGTKLTYGVQTDEGEDLKVWDLTTNEVSDLAGKAGVNESFPTMSPYGVTTYYNLVDFRGYPKVDSYIFRDREGVKEELVTRHPSGRDLFPQLSPDGQELYWMWIDNNDPNDRIIYKADA